MLGWTWNIILRFTRRYNYYVEDKKKLFFFYISELYYLEIKYFDRSYPKLVDTYVPTHLRIDIKSYYRYLYGIDLWSAFFMQQTSWASHE